MPPSNASSATSPPIASPSTASPSAKPSSTRPSSTSPPLLLDPRNEYVFRTLCVENPPLLLDLINAVLGCKPAMKAIEILNPEVMPNALERGLIGLQLLTHDETGQGFNIDVQMRRMWALPPHDTSRPLHPDVEPAWEDMDDAGVDFDRRLPAIAIHLLDLTLVHDQPDKALWTFDTREIGPPDVVLSQKSLQLNLLELPKADRLRQLGKAPLSAASPLSAWVAFFGHFEDADAMRRIHHPAVREALSALRRISGDERNRVAALKRDDVLFEQIHQAREASRALGASLLIRVLGARFGPLPASIVDCIRAGTVDDHARWAEQFLVAESLDAVFKDTRTLH